MSTAASRGGRRAGGRGYEAARAARSASLAAMAGRLVGLPLLDL
jgi:hypothetical protein